MAQVPVGGKYNVYTATLDVTAKTLVFANVIAWSMENATIKSIWSVTATKAIPLGINLTSCTLSYSAGLPIYTYLFVAMPAGVANGDTLNILIDVPDVLMDYSVLCYSASKV